MTLPLQVTPVAVRQFFTATGAPAVGYTLSYFVVGTDTPLEVFADSDGNVSLGTSVDIGDLGYPITSSSAITSIYPPLGGYKEVLKDADGVAVYSADHLENVAETFLGTQANIQTQGSQSVTGTYNVADTDNWITSEGATVNLPDAANRGTVLAIQSMSATATSVVPNGSQTVNGLTGTFTIAGASSPSFPTVWFYSDGISNWRTLVGA